jgi:DNA-binding NarL/FixJ family response regulator
VDALRREQILRAYVHRARRFDEIASSRVGSTGLFEQSAAASRVDCNPVGPAARSRRRCLSPRQEAVLQLLAKGFSNKEIGPELDVGVETVKSHVKQILISLGARNRTHAVYLAFERGILTTSQP